MDQITGLVDSGCEIEIYAGRVLKNVVVHAEIAKYSLMDRAHSLAPPDVSSRINRILRGLYDVAKAFPSAPTVVARTLNPLRLGRFRVSFTPFYGVAPFLRDGAYDIIHCQFGPNGTRAVELRELGALKGPILTQFYGYDASSYVQTMGPDVYRELFEKGELFLCVSERIRSELHRLGCDERKTRLHRLGVKVKDIPFKPARRAPSGGEVRVLTVGRLVEKKGIAFGIRALAKAIQSHPRLTYTIVGTGPEQAALTSLVSELGLEHVVRFAGAQPRSEVQRLMQDCQILLAPSVRAENGDEEGMPVVLMEALASGLPVVSTRHAGIPELISHGESGMLADERDVHGLVNGLLFLIDHPNESETMARAGRSVVERNHDTDVLNALLLGIYGEFAARARS